MVVVVKNLFAVQGVEGGEEGQLEIGRHVLVRQEPPHVALGQPPAAVVLGPPVQQRAVLAAAAAAGLRSRLAAAPGAVEGEHGVPATHGESQRNG
jgi:hypothetical protein